MTSMTTLLGAATRRACRRFDSVPVGADLCCQCLAGPLDHPLQGFRGVLAWVQTLAMTGNALIVDEGKAEAAFARGLDLAVQRGEGVGQGVDGRLNLMLSGHVWVKGSCELRYLTVKINDPCSSRQRGVLAGIGALQQD